MLIYSILYIAKFEYIKASYQDEIRDPVRKSLAEPQQGANANA